MVVEIVLLILNRGKCSVDRFSIGLRLVVVGRGRNVVKMNCIDTIFKLLLAA